MKIHSRAPLRISFAGGGTDISAYSDVYGGSVFNSTIGMYAYCTIEPTDDGKIVFTASDRNEEVELPATSTLPLDGELILHRGVYNRIVKDFNGGKPLSLKMWTSVDAPAGSGLGTSSTLTVAILQCYNEWLQLGLGQYDIAKLAYDIERIDCNLSGGKQDQYAATFGGFNFMEFKQNGDVFVNTLRIDKKVINHLECSLLLFWSGKSRESAKIIDQQIKNTKQKDEKSIEAMHKMKESSVINKEAILSLDFDTFCTSLREGWEAKKKTASIITNTVLEEIISRALHNGAEAVKVSGAGGGGFVLLYCKPVNRQRLMNAMDDYKSGKVYPVKFTKYGVESWTMKD